MKAQGTSKVLIGNANHSDQISNVIAYTVEVSSSQSSQYVNGEIPDNVGDFFQSQEGLAQFRQLHTSQAMERYLELSIVKQNLRWGVTDPI